MKIKEGFILRKVGGSNVIVPTGNETNEFNGMITTNDTGAFIFEKLQSGMNSDEIVKTITEEFEIDSERRKYIWIVILAKKGITDYKYIIYNNRERIWFR